MIGRFAARMPANAHPEGQPNDRSEAPHRVVQLAGSLAQKFGRAASSFSRPLARRECPMKPTLLLCLIAGSVLLVLAAHSGGQSSGQPAEAVTGFDDQSNGFSDPDRRKADQKCFE